eukprot:jgi/Orpsp1_1/1181956/evm.model.c7180000079253.2
MVQDDFEPSNFKINNSNSDNQDFIASSSSLINDSTLSEITINDSIDLNRNNTDTKSQKLKNSSNTIQEENEYVIDRRFEEFDLARSIPLLLLPVIHIYEEFKGINAFSEEFVKTYSWILKLCTLMPSVFMLLMGANVHFSKRTTPEYLMKRGKYLLYAGVLLNVIRYIIPSIIVAIFKRDATGIIGDKGSLYYTLTPDIYDFAGLALILLGVLKKYNYSSLTILLISIVMVTINTIIPKFSTGSPHLDGFIGRFIYMNEDSCFPLGNWFIFPAIGYFIGEFYKKFETEEIRKEFNKKMFYISIIVLIAFWFVLRSYDLDPILIMTSPANEYITDFVNAIMLTFLAGIWFAIFYVIYFKINETKICKFLVLISKEILPFYVIQWVIIGWAEYICEGFIKETEYINHAIFWISVIVTTLLTIL